MNQILMTNAYLLNWYGFVDKTIPIGSGLSLITGENECGKSTILDAIKYAFTGDTDFNKATSATRVGTGKRTLASYTRCLIDPDSRKYARPASVYPNVYTHIALEYHNELVNRDFVLGVVIETNSSDSVDHYWYALDRKTLKDVSFFNEKDGKRIVLSAKQFREKNRVELMNKTNGIVKFMNMTGLKLQQDGISKYQRKLKNIMTYNPEAKIQQFIKDSVLEEKSINLNKLKDAKLSIDDITKTFESIENEIMQLTEILDAFTEYGKLCFRLTKEDAKRLYRDVRNAQKMIETNRQKLQNNLFEIRRITELLKQEIREKEEKEIELRNANRQMDRMDGTRALQDEKEKLQMLQIRGKEIDEKAENLRVLSERIQEYLEQIGSEMKMPDLCDVSVTASVRNTELSAFRSTLADHTKDLNRQVYDNEHALREVQDEMNRVDEVIRTCQRNLPDYSRVTDQLGLMNEINQKFKEMQIPSEARFSASYVLEVKDEAWRNSIETFLGIHRYSILVEPQYFDIANQVMNDSRYRYVELVNTKLLNRRDQFEVVEDSLLHQLEIRNETARKYFTYWLGRIHAVDLDQVPEYENAISKEGKISRNMSVSFLNFRKLKSYCLGQDAIALNLDRAQKERKELEKQEKELLIIKNDLDLKHRRAETMTALVQKEYDLDIPQKRRENRLEIRECKDRIHQLDEALKNNSEYFLLSERIGMLEERLKALGTLINDKMAQEQKLKTESDVLEKEISEKEGVLSEKQKKLDELTDTHPLEVKEAKEEYDGFAAGTRKTGDVILPVSYDRIISDRNACERTITNRQTAYNTGRRVDETLPVGLDCEAVYRRRQNRLQVDNLEEIKAKLAEQTKKYEQIFKNEFVLKIKTNIENAQQDIRDINRQLKHLQFSTTYQFEVKLMTGTSDYARILEYAEYLKKTNRIHEDQMILSTVADYDEKEAERREKEIKEVVNRIIAVDNDQALNEYADYRNYMDYEVLVTNEEITNGRLSRLAGYNSGAGTQIPYTIILSAALSIIYNARQNSTRLVFIDEPFEKMSDKNIRVMLDFFRSQHFQVIFCAPPNKLDSIGKQCDAIIPVRKIHKSNMTLGAVRFNEQV
ncbi:MAG: SbcC/MukB-like Walker B domain-containing protein [Bulleidia sp.]